MEDDFALLLDENWRSVRHEAPDLIHLAIRHGDASGGPVHRPVQSSEPPQPVLDAVNHDIAAGVNAAGACGGDVGCARIADMKRAMKTASPVAAVDDVGSLRGSCIALPGFGLRPATTERDAALTEIFRIVALRLDQRVTAPDRLRVHGRLSTHALDTHAGCPASGVAIELFEVASSGELHLLLRTITNADGRTDRPLIAEQPIPIAQYELQFGIGAYFARQAASVADPPFLGVVPIRFAVAEPEAHYHVPIIVTPWSYSTYRGS